MLSEPLELRWEVESRLVSLSDWCHSSRVFLARLPEALECRWVVEPQTPLVVAAISESLFFFLGAMSELPVAHCSVSTLIVARHWRLIVAISELPVAHCSVGTLIVATETPDAHCSVGTLLAVTCHWRLEIVHDFWHDSPGDYACARAHVVIHHWRYVNKRRRRWAHNLR